MNNITVKVTFWNDKLKVGINNYKEAIALIDGKLIYLKSEVNNGTLRYRNGKNIFTYNKIKKSITHKNFTLQEYCPF